MTAASTIAPPISWLLVGASLNTSHIQNGISGVSSVPIRDDCAAGKWRDRLVTRRFLHQMIQFCLGRRQLFARDRNMTTLLGVEGGD